MGVDCCIFLFTVCSYTLLHCLRYKFDVMFGDIKCVCICIRSVREEMEISEDTMNNNQARNTPDCNNNGNLRTLICTVSSSIELTRLIVAFFTFCIYPLSYNASSTMVIFMFEASISGESGVLL